MSGRYLIDTSVLVFSLRLNSDVDQKLATYGDLYVSAITLGELYYGAERSLHRDENIADIDKVSQRVNLLTVNIATARVYSVIKRGQERKGLLLPGERSLDSGNSYPVQSCATSPRSPFQLGT